jgi:hypothetical protein
MPTDVSVPASTCPCTPMTAFRRISSTVVAGSFRSWLARKPGGSASLSTFSPTLKATSGLTAD